MSRKLVDLTNCTFGSMKVLRRSNHTDKYNRIYWICVCGCGSTTILTTRRILHCSDPKCNSCKINKYFERDGYMVGLTTKGEEFFFDKQDYEKVKDYTWHIDHRGYVVSYIYSEQKYISLHALIMNPDRELVVDHLFGVKHDNRRSMLRVVDQSTNMKNRCDTVYDFEFKVLYLGNKFQVSVLLSGNRIALNEFDSLLQVTEFFHKYTGINL